MIIKSHGNVIDFIVKSEKVTVKSKGKCAIMCNAVFSEYVVEVPQLVCAPVIWLARISMGVPFP